MEAQDIKRLIDTLAERIIAASDELTGLDQAIGDGDHGTNMDRGFKAIVAALDARTAPDSGVTDQAAGAGLKFAGFEENRFRILLAIATMLEKQYFPCLVLLDGKEISQPRHRAKPAGMFKSQRRKRNQSDRLFQFGDRRRHPMPYGGGAVGQFEAGQIFDHICELLKRQPILQSLRHQRNF